MIATADITTWIALFMGLYSLAASIGELRSPGFWAGMLDDFDKAPGLLYLTGIVVLALGATIYLVNPWDHGDWLSVLVTIIGVAMVVEGMMFLAIGGPFVRLSRAMMGKVSRFRALFALGIGIALIIVALLRII